MSQVSTEYQVRAEMFAMLYEDCQKPIERYLVKWIHDQESARDLCQETFAYFWKFLLTKETVVQPAATYIGRLYTTAKYRAIDYLRRNKPIVYLSQSEGEANSWFDELRLEGLEDRIDLICLQDDLIQLPPQQRDCLVEYAMGYKQKEIAAKKGITESAVSAYVSRGKTELRRKYYPVPIDLKQWNARIECRGGTDYRMTDDLESTDAYWAVYAAPKSERPIRGVKASREWWEKFANEVDSGRVKVSTPPQYVTISEMRKLMHVPSNFPEKAMQGMAKVYILPNIRKGSISDILVALLKPRLVKEGSQQANKP